jgi:hypothetical protein
MIGQVEDKKILKAFSFAIVEKKKMATNLMNIPWVIERSGPLDKNEL